MKELELFDSHAHLDFGSETKLADILSRAHQAGVRNIVSIGAGLSVQGAFDALNLVASHTLHSPGIPNLWATVGVHPHDASLGIESGTDPKQPVPPDIYQSWQKKLDLTLARHRALALHPRVVAIGEIGLDFHYDHSPRQMQRELFRRYIQLAKELKLPLVIHARAAEQEVAEILKREQAGQVAGVIHCFSADEYLQQAALELGFYFGLTGILTFPKAHQIRKAAQTLPLERLLLETDSPYLAPVPHRGRRNEPAYVAHVATQLAEIKKLDRAQVASQTSQNAKHLFGLEAKLADRGQIVYWLADNLYLNITNRCNLACRFCIKHSGLQLGGAHLGIIDEPNQTQLLSAIETEISGRRPTEVVFCGIGEPLLRPDLVIQVGKQLRQQGLYVRVNTDGLANLVHQQDIADQLTESVDAFSISLNSHNAAHYANLCPSAYGEKAFGAVCDFIQRTAARYPQVQATVVRHQGVDQQAAQELAKRLGASFRVRG